MGNNCCHKENHVLEKRIWFGNFKNSQDDTTTKFHIEFLLYMKVSKCIQFLVYPTGFEMVTNYLEKTLK